MDLRALQTLGSAGAGRQGSGACGGSGVVMTQGVIEFRSKELAGKRGITTAYTCGTAFPALKVPG